MSPTGADASLRGITGSGRRFRPSDRAERLGGLTSAFGHDQELAYSPRVMPVALGAHKAVIVGRKLETLEPPAEPPEPVRARLRKDEGRPRGAPFDAAGRRRRAIVRPSP